jgi:GNAT superfamily N-acetyltransferase
MPSLPYDSIRTWTEGEYLVTTDRARFDGEVATAFLVNDSYWVQARTPDEEARAVANSRCYSVVHESTGRMVGGARAVTDHVSFAWIADVFVLPEARGQGLGKFLIRCVTDDLTHVERLFLGTRDAHGLYAQYGFVPSERNERWMERLLD